MTSPDHDPTPADAVLAPCPFCGGRAERQCGEMTGHIVSCEDCGAQTLDSNRYNEATALWNRRAPASAPAEIERLVTLYGASWAAVERYRDCNELRTALMQCNTARATLLAAIASLVAERDAAVARVEALRTVSDADVERALHAGDAAMDVFPGQNKGEYRAAQILAMRAALAAFVGGRT